MRELGPPDPDRVAALPTLSRITALGAAAVLVPGIVVFIACRLAGLDNGPAGLSGLGAMLVGMCLFPFYLRSLSRRFPS